ncbi:MAG: spermidine synthase [Gemmatimonadetes bacterium]|nr:spermidine synthase [Gemmatimonadota bacterium]
MSGPISPTGGGRFLVVVLCVLFVLSGAAGLIYESIWARYLGLFVGHSAYAQILVLAIFMGGMALGAMAVGARSRRLADPLRWYAYAELAIGLLGLIFHDGYRAGTQLAYDVLFPALAGTGGLTIAKWVVAALLILPQSVLLGTTFPLMGAGVLRRVPDGTGRVLALLYFANSLGAAGGVLLAGFYLLAAAGLPGTVLAAAMINLVVGLGALAVARYHASSPADQSTERVAAGAPDTSALGLLTRRQLWRALLWVSFGTAVASFIYEVSWLRMLSLVLGSATHSFELMLSAFILGLALGSYWVRTRADRWAHPLRVLGLLQWVMGFTALATVPLYAQSFEWMAGLMRTFAQTGAGYTGFTLSRYALCLAVMLPATFCAGTTLPLITRTLLAGGAGERAVGSVYGVNTIGSIFGVMVAGLVLVPGIGVQWTLVSGATIDMGLGVALLALSVTAWPAARRLGVAGAGLTLVVAGVIGVAARVDARVLSSGVFRFGQIPSAQSVDVLFHEDGRTATVSVARLRETGHVWISTNGKTDGSVPGWWFPPCTDTVTRRPLMSDIATQVMAPLVTVAHAPHARTGVIIGHGTGMSAHALLAGSTIERVVSIEIEPEIIRGSRLFYPGNRRVFDDRRSSFVFEDARAYLAASGERFDLIFSEPSNPWVSGVSSLFTTEFYQHVRRHLAPGGVFGQWLHRSGLTDGLILSVLAGLHQHFPFYEVFETNETDLLIVAGTGPLPRPDWSVVGGAALESDLCRVVPLTPETLEATRLTHRAALAPLLDGWEQPNSDFYPVLDLGAERARYAGQQARGFGELVTRFDPTAPFFGRRREPASDATVPIYGARRVTALALGAAVRGVPVREHLDSTARPPALDAVLFRHRAWERMLASDVSPGSWPVWLASFRAIERERNGGTAGFGDVGFYQSVQRYVQRHAAPAAVRDVVAFAAGGSIRTNSRRVR